jgi:hypothetical protein
MLTRLKTPPPPHIYFFSWKFVPVIFYQNLSAQCRFLLKSVKNNKLLREGPRIFFVAMAAGLFCVGTNWGLRIIRLHERISLWDTNWGQRNNLRTKRSSLCKASGGSMISRSLRDRYNKCEISQFTINVQTREAGETVDDLYISHPKNRRRYLVRWDCSESGNE